MIQFDVGGLFTQFKGMKPQPRMGRFETVQKPDGFLAVRTGLRPEDIDIEAGVALHAGSLPRPDDLIELNRARLAEGFGDEAAFQERLCTSLYEMLAHRPEPGQIGVARARR